MQNKRTGLGSYLVNRTAINPIFLPVVATFILLTASLPQVIYAQQSEEELAKKLQNPVANLISVPFQNNFDFRLNTDEDGFRYTLNVQPVIPFSISNDWNLITRTIVPIIYQDEIFVESGDQFGLGDTLFSLFFSPKALGPGGTIWGVGPVFLFPTGTDELLGSEKWGAGPTGVVLKQSGPWTYGVLANHVWSFAGDDDRSDVNLTFLQPFLSYTFPSAFTILGNTESTYDWKENQWTVPLNAGASQVFKLGQQVMSIAGLGRYFAEGPAGAPEWGFRVVLTFLFPK